MPQELKDSLEQLAKENNRSMTAEIVARLEMSLAEPDAVKAAERRKLELVNSYVEWCRKTGHEPYKSFSQFCRAYAEDEEESTLERIITIPKIDPKYLSDLFSIWIVERPSRFPVLADSVATQPMRQPVDVAAQQEWLSQLKTMLAAQEDSVMRALENKLEQTLARYRVGDEKTD